MLISPEAENLYIMQTSTFVEQAFAKVSSFMIIVEYHKSQKFILVYYTNRLARIASKLLKFLSNFKRICG